MKRGIFSRLLAFALCLAAVLSLCACGNGGKQKALSLENGWYAAEDSLENANKYLKGFSDKAAEPVMLSEITTGAQSIFCSNTFNAALDADSKDSVILNVYDAQGNITLWLNGKEIAASEMESGRASFDITKQIKKSGKNALVIAASKIGEEGLAAAGSMVDITVHAPVSIMDVYTVSDTEAQQMKVYAVINNATDSEAQLSLKADIASVDNNIVAANTVKSVTAPAGESTVEMVFDASDFIEWSNENPFLYMLTVTAGEEVYSDYVGYKSFAVAEDGTFIINGKPIMVKAASVSADECYARNLYEILNYIKVAGFNTVHVGDGAATEKLLEYCDRLGLLVYEGATATSVELAKRDRSHVSLCLADGNPTAWKDAGAAVAVVNETSIANSLGEEVEFDIVELDITSSCNEEALMGIISEAGENIFIKSVGVSSLKDNEVNAELVMDWYNGYGIDAVMAIGNLNADINEANVKDNSVLLDYVRAKNISGLCFTTDISRFKTDLTEIINDDLNDLRFNIITDKANAFDNDSIKLNISLSNFHVLSGGRYNILVKITGEDGPVYKKNVDLDIDSASVIQSVLTDTVSLKGLDSGEYTISAEFKAGAHAVCGEKTLLVMEKADLAKLSGKVYTLGVENRELTALLEERGAKVEKFTGTQKGVIIIGESCADAALIEKAYENGTKVVVLGAQNKESLPVQVTAVAKENIPVLHTSALTEGMVNTNVVYEVSTGGRICANGYLEGAQAEQLGMSAFAVNADGTVTAGAMFALYEGKYVLSTLDIENNISNPYAAAMLLNAIK